MLPRIIRRTLSKLADDARQRFEVVQNSNEAPPSTTPLTQPSQPAPVMIFHAGRKMLDVEAMSRVFKFEDVPHQIRSVEHDLPNKEAILRETKGFPLPCAFIGGEPVGSLRELERLQKSPSWTKILYPEG